MVWSGPRPFLPDQRLDSPVPDKNSGTGTGTARDRLDWSGPGPDPVQMVPGGTFILGHIDMVRGTWGGRWVVRSWGGMAQHQTRQSHPPPCSAQSVATNGPLQDSGGGGVYVVLHVVPLQTLSYRETLLLFSSPTEVSVLGEVLLVH